MRDGYRENPLVMGETERKMNMEKDEILKGLKKMLKFEIDGLDGAKKMGSPDFNKVDSDCWSKFIPMHEESIEVLSSAIKAIEAPSS